MSYSVIPTLSTTNTFEKATPSSIPSIKCIKSATGIFAVCKTPPGESEKTIELQTFSLREGAHAIIRFFNTNIAPEPTLNINNTGAYPIIYRKHTIETDRLSTNRIYQFVFTGSAYEVVGDLSITSGSSATSTVPSITGPENVAIGVPTEFSFFSSCGLEGGIVTSFDVTFNGYTTRLEAVDESASFSITIPTSAEPNDKFSLSVVANDSYGGSSNKVEKIIYAYEATVVPPTIITPVSGTVVSPQTISITTSDIRVTSSSEELDDTIAAMYFKVTTDAAGNDIVWESEEIATTSTTNIIVIEPSLVQNTNYYIWVKHKGAVYGVSGWGSSANVMTDKAQAPTIISPAQQAYIAAKTVTIETSEFACVSGTSDTHYSSYFKICNDSEGNQVVYLSGEIIENKERFTADINLTPGFSYYIFARHKGTASGLSEWSAPVQIIASKVNTPVITAPSTNTEVVVNDGLTVATNEFSVTGVTDIHVSSDWKITTDLEGIMVVKEDLESSDLLNHTFVDFLANNNATMYAWVRYNGMQNGSSDWACVAFIAKSGIVLSSGRTIYRHTSNMGSVLEFTDGTPRKVLVLDAVYRTVATFGTYETDTSLTNYTSSNVNNTWFVNGGSVGTSSDGCASITDSSLNALWANSIDENTSRQNCDVFAEYSDTRAVEAARSIFVDDMPCDVPNIQTLMRIFCDSESIDALDPTIASNPSKALGTANSNGSWKIGSVERVWSSTEYGSSGMRCVKNDGNCNSELKNNIFAIVPVLELE